jgi:hypothetical protein
MSICCDTENKTITTIGYSSRSEIYSEMIKLWETQYMNHPFPMDGNSFIENGELLHGWKIIYGVEPHEN